MILFCKQNLAGLENKTELTLLSTEIIGIKLDSLDMHPARNNLDATFLYYRALSGYKGYNLQNDLIYTVGDFKRGASFVLNFRSFVVNLGWGES